MTSLKNPAVKSNRRKRVEGVTEYNSLTEHNSSSAFLSASVLIHKGNYYSPLQYDRVADAVKYYRDWCLQNELPQLREYVIVMACPKLYQEIQAHILLVKKRPGSLHEGCFNLPGGSINGNEKPETAALRELLEETGQKGTFPQLVGAIIPSTWDYDPASGQPPFLVHVLRTLIEPDQPLSMMPDQPAQWFPLTMLQRVNCVPNTPIIASLVAIEYREFILQDSYFLVGEKKSQQIITTYKPQSFKHDSMRNTMK